MVVRGRDGLDLKWLGLESVDGIGVGHWLGFAGGLPGWPGDLVAMAWNGRDDSSVASQRWAVGAKKLSRSSGRAWCVSCQKNRTRGVSEIVGREEPRGRG